MEGPRPIIELWAAKQEIGQKKAPDPLGIGRLDVVRTSGGQVLKTLPVTTKGPTERSVFRTFRREVEDTASFRRLGTVEPAAERARELGSGVQVIRMCSLAPTVALVPEKVLVSMVTFKLGQVSPRVAVIVPLVKLASKSAASVYQRNVPVAVLFRRLHSGNPAATVVGSAVVRHIGTGQPIADALDKANAEIREFLRTGPSQLPREQPTHRSGCACSQLPREGRPLPERLRWLPYHHLRSTAAAFRPQHWH